jgi:hypothetical protein
LGDVASQHDARILPYSGQHSEQHIAFERLRLVDDHESVMQAAAPDVCQRQHLQDVAVQHLVEHFGADQSAQRVEDRLRPRVHLFLLAAGQEAQVLTSYREHRPEHHDPAVRSAFHHRL